MRVQSYLQHEERFSKFSLEEWGHAEVQLVEALSYKPEGRGFDCKLLIDTILSTATSNRN